MAYPPHPGHAPGPIRGNRGHDMNKLGFALASYALLLASAGAANAGCVGRGDRFRNIAENPTVSNYFTTDNGRCANSFLTGGQSMLTDASIASMPQHGTLRQVDRFRFFYKANAGYKGEERYAIRLCGRTLTGSGCATMNYFGTIE